MIDLRSLLLSRRQGQKRKVRSGPVRSVRLWDPSPPAHTVGVLFLGCCCFFPPSTNQPLFELFYSLIAYQSAGIARHFHPSPCAPPVWKVKRAVPFKSSSPLSCNSLLSTPTALKKKKGEPADKPDTSALDNNNNNKIYLIISNPLQREAEPSLDRSPRLSCWKDSD